MLNRNLVVPWRVAWQSLIWIPASPLQQVLPRASILVSSVNGNVSDVLITYFISFINNEECISSLQNLNQE